MRQKYRSLAPARCSAARRTVETAQELRDFLRPFTDECPVTFEDGRPLYIAYKIDADSNGKIFAGVVRQNSDIRRVLPDPVQLKS
jgi:IS1 family transposase